MPRYSKRIKFLNNLEKTIAYTESVVYREIELLLLLAQDDSLEDKGIFQDIVDVLEIYCEHGITAKNIKKRIEKKRYLYMSKNSTRR